MLSGFAGVLLPLSLAAQTPAAGAPKTAAAAAPVAASPSAASPVAASPFPKPNPKSFTAASPSVGDVDAFLKQLWGFDANRIWSVEAILSTNAPGVSKIVVFVGDKTAPGKVQQTVFFTTPDGKHAIADNVVDFGPNPFADTRKLLQLKADGPARGAAGKELLLVEFSDLQCPHCKDAQPIMDQLATDFPQARVVFQNYPLTEIHPQAFQAAAVGLCVRKAKGDDAFFKYAQAVFDVQGALTAQDVVATLDSAVTRAGGEPAAMIACAKTQPITDAVNASIETARNVGLDSTPILFVNGQPVPIGNVPYELLKKIVAYRAAQDGVAVTVQPSLKTLK